MTTITKMQIVSALWLLEIAGFCIGICGGHGPGPGPGTSFVIPRRRSSMGDGYSSSQMQSRAVDMRVQLEVFEGEPKGTVVGYIPTKTGFTYRFNEPPREFTLDPNSGEIKTNTILDREVIRDRYDLVVLSSQPTYPIEVRITVLDINDNAPEFPEPSIAVSFSESAAAGTRLLLDAATDRDIGNNSVTDDYRIVDGNPENKFRLAVTTNPSGDVSYLHLETTGKLDRETCGLYVLNVSAQDGGNPPKNGYLQVNVTVADVNDNPPIFDHSDYIVSLNESVSPGTPVLQVMASDNDLGDNSKITYYLADTEQQFTVDPESGVISTTLKLSCPHQNCPTFARGGKNCPKSCVFTVFARDHGSPRQDGRTYVTVNLVDTNDHDPVMRFQYFPLTGSYATVDENAINGSVVAAVSVVDMDEGLNGDCDIQIISGNELHHFRLEKTPSFDIVRVNGVLDREEIGKYNLTVVATDKGSPPRTATAHLIIHVNDVNDHEPVFEKSEYSAVLSEVAPPGTYVASIGATDEDTGVNAQISYDFVSGNTKQWFTIDSVSGLITTRAALDREVQGTCELSISARDGGPNPKWAYTQLKVTILDENDEAPQFSQQQINVSLSENTPPHTLVAMLTAADHDQGTNGSVTYSLHSRVQQRYPDVFAMDALTGQLTTKTDLDREMIASYEIQVVARDQGIPLQSATATVYLNVEDVNDNSPEFYPKKYFLTIADDTPIGTSLMKLSATDRDDGDNAILSYNLESGGDGLFMVDSWSGAISLRSNLGTSQKPLHKLMISAKDRGDRRSEYDAIVEIIKKTKLEELEFDSYSGYEFQIVEDHSMENAQIGREVGRTQIRSSTTIITTTTTTPVHSIEYSIIYGDPKGNFKIDERTGIITTATKIDREVTIMYTLTVVARRGLAYGKTTVNVSILDLNDNAPMFSRDRDDIHLPENTAVGQEIYLSRARDKDSGVNSRVTYSITYNPDDQFRINEATGVLYLNRHIRAEPGTNLHIELTATDGGTPPLSTKNTLTITIADVNDHTPVFDHTSYETSLLESTAVNARFFALGASDADLNENGRISYVISEGNGDGKFGIFPDGYLFVKSQLDREERDYYALTISCHDHGEPSRSSMVPVIIRIIDENDNAPQFTNTTFTFTIAENEQVDSFVGKLTAIDRDIGRNAELIFTLSNVQDDFTIDPRNGFIKTMHEFDRESLVQSTGQPFVILEAIVSDNGVVRLKDKVKVKIIISDVNDNAPQFIRAPYKVQISEGSSIDTQLIRVYTIDADEGLNGDVFYSIESGNDEGRFNIHDATGQITLAKKIDREVKSMYKLDIVAHDAAVKGRLSSTTIVTIDVLDENDNAPEFTQTNSQIFVNETTQVGKELMRFRATDADLGANSQITFSISSGNRRDAFHIDSNTGSLFLHKTLDYEDTTSYNLNITASDSGNPQLSTTITFIVAVIDENDNPPNFPNTAIVRQIREGISVNTPIVTITAEDPDSGVNGIVTYTISHQEPLNQQRYFGINTVSGVIITLKEIDRESIDTFRLTVVATDQATVETKRLSAEKIVTVIIEDINDNAPVFASMNAAVLSLTDIRVAPGRDGSVIMNVFARDADSSTNGLVTYEMVSGNSELFKLHRSTGAISLRKAITTPEARYKLAVKATDEAVQSERKSSDAYVTIFASASVNNGPKFEQSEYFGSVYENEMPGTSVATVMAKFSSSVDIEYYVINVTGGGKQVDRLFDIDTKLGILSTAAQLDRELVVDTYEIEVYAIIIGGSPKTSKTKLIVKCAVGICKMALSSAWVVFVLSLNFLSTNAGVSMHDPFYCYAQDPIQPQVGMFSSITSYETNRGRNMVDPNVSTCTPAKFWFVSRHGTRIQSRIELESIFAHSARLHQEILNNYEAGRTTLCAADIALLRNWRFDPNITLEMEQQLTVAGWNEFQELAQRYQTAFPTLLPSTYSHSNFLFRTTHTARTLGSMRAFADGLFGHNGYQQVIFENVPNPDPLLRPHDFCPLLNDVRDDTTEPQAFIDGPEYQQMLSQVSAKLGFHGSRHLSFNDINVLNNICKFEQIWNLNVTSPICASFSVANYEVLEYYDDLFFYYRYGYGHPSFRTLYENIYCYAMQDLLTFIASDNPSDHKAKLYGGHTATVQMLALTLGLFEDDEHLTRHNFAQQTFRKWRTSVHAAMGTNFVVVKYDCGDEDNDILFLHSEVPLQIPGCQSNGICKQSFKRAQTYCRNS